MKPAQCTNEDQNRRVQTLQEKILEIFGQGFTISTDTVHFLDSTFGVSEIEGLRQILGQTESSDAETLREMLFFPEKSQRLQLEPILERKIYQAEDLPLICALIMKKKPEVVFRYLDHDLKIRLTAEPARKFVARLGIDKQLEQRTKECIRKTCSRQDAYEVQVRLRTAPYELNAGGAAFFRKFLLAFGRTKPFWDLFDFVLGFLQECDPDADFQQELQDKKFFLELALKKAEQLERDLKTQPVEILHMQRVNILSLDRRTITHEIEMVEDLLKALYPPPGP
ncbi:MAG: hypothetical protein K9K64_00755 [Desulfohalobiaceae bacterium]|nr:hypothetical protein [Desulfohalobiaceae bacterium]